MADTGVNSTTISQTDSGFPDYLDFNALREDAINYLGDLTGKIWTDYNLHDPGITTIEMFCYALLDLGYRTNFPTKDIFTKNPSDISPDSNFFTPSRILTCNPLTIIDYKKMLIDIDGVKNAWLKVADKQIDLCRKDDKQKKSAKSSPSCETFLNGLYHVLIELENPHSTKEESDAVLDKVKKSLMSHRNLCEDFVDISILCSFDIGVCADIELNNDADAEEVYKNMIVQLQQFFSPSPKFYTLQELLDKNKPIEDIFAGRPYNLTQSYGFVDTAELEEIELKKEIHLSDVYQEIFKVPGIKTVRRLRLQNCSNKSELINWKFQLPENFIPNFSLSCSGFQFSQNGKILIQDLTKFNQFLDVNFSANARILHTQALPYLDAEIPQGIYRNDLGNYYSIQNEFPRVYGIGDGGLPTSASNERKAQALQFKAYLLFFDQLFANYLAQLQNIRSLFSLTGSENTAQQTYFLQEPQSVPDLQKLIRFQDVVNDQGIIQQGSGATLGIPVSRKNLVKALAKTPFDEVAFSQAITTPYDFISDNERQVAIKQLTEDLLNADFADGTGEDYSNNFFQAGDQSDDSCWIFYIFTSSADIAIVCKGNFNTMADAQQALTSMKYLATFRENCTGYLTANGKFSFNIGSNLMGYANFLQRIIENKTLYRKRKSDFLDHLLARFAEQFTDYALLSFNFMSPVALEDSVLLQKQKFLSNYDKLSSGRGQAYNYSTNYRGDEFVSGFEKKVAALAGFDSGNNTLCNFVVEEFEEWFLVRIKLGDKLLFTSPEKFYSDEQAKLAAKDILTALQSKDNYQVYFDKIRYAYTLKVFYGNNKEAFFDGSDANETEMLNISSALARIFSVEPVEQDIFVSEYVFKIIIREAKDDHKEIFSSKQFFPNYEKAVARYNNIEKSITKISFWDEHEKNHPLFQEIYLDNTNAEELKFVNLNAFKIDIDDDIVGKPDKFTFSLLDHGNNFKFLSLQEFGSYNEAEESCKRLIILLADIRHFTVSYNARQDRYFLQIMADGKAIAESTAYESELQAQHAINNVNKLVISQLYLLSVEKRPYRWKFQFYLNNEKGNEFVFNSIDQFESADQANENGKIFFDNIQTITAKINNKELQLVSSSKKINAAAFESSGQSKPNLKEIKSEVDELLEMKKEIILLNENNDPASFNKFVDNDILNKEKKFVYRLVDKNHLHAVYVKNDITDEKEETAIAKKKELFQDTSVYDYVDICLGGDIFQERIDASGQVWYHYQIKSRTPLFSVKDLVLFESVQGYVSEEDAQQAFDSNYLQIFRAAMDEKKYGNSSAISFKETIIHIPDPDKEIKSIVFIPDKTKEIISWYNEDHLKKELTKIAKKYPVRFITNAKTDAAEFEHRFPCEPPVYKPVKNDCASKASAVNYYYYVLTDKNGQEIWQSVRHYETADEARNRFYFFFRLLFYPGNYVVKESLCRCYKEDASDCTCAWEICIREVLAESRVRFEYEKTAWSEVEKFICVAQSKDGFHAYFNHLLCNNSFFVACEGATFIHPCKYETEDERDRSKDTLLEAIKEYYKNDKLPFLSDVNPEMIYDINGDELAKLVQPIAKHHSICEWYFEVIRIVLDDTISDEAKYLYDNNKFYLLNKSKAKVAESVNIDNIEQWKLKLLEFSYYFPVVENSDKKFCIEIKLPHFNHFGEDIASDEPCGCGKGHKQGHDKCFSAWKSKCCFDTCARALEYYFAEVGKLRTYKNYHSVFYCDCEGFGIELISVEDIIAVNPQSYITDGAVCDAISRSKKLINAEGLHVVEHILLRPRSNKDCDDCDCLKSTCNETLCKFVWQEGDINDPCNNPVKEICFVPGSDPYSFIATIALPAWPQRFRSDESHAIIENLLQREAPAHVLLRVLWLTPHDLCCFESRFRRWNHWLTWDQHCKFDYKVCEFSEFLFTKEFKCLDDCVTCLPCKENKPSVVPCFTAACDEQAMPGKYDIVNQVSEIFCWGGMECGGTKKNNEPTDTVNQVKTGKAATPLTKNNNGDVDAENKIDERFTKYRDEARSIVTASEKNNIAVAVLSFLQSAATLADLKNVIESILKNVKPKAKSKQALTTDQVKKLTSTCVFYYLDRAVFDNKKNSLNNELQSMVDDLKKARIAPEFGEWNADEVKLIKPDAEINNIEKLLK
ncbi:MAG TPA: hypothetical protein VKT28_02070 [Puia sp.]|nr:hypothetical protein [Puia sp.]